jgi:hypothetical protein
MRAPARKPTVVPGRGMGRRPRDAGLLGFAASRIGCGPGERIRREEAGERRRRGHGRIEEDVRSEGVG